MTNTPQLPEGDHAPVEADPPAPKIIDVTTWYGGHKHRADVSTARTDDNTGRRTYETLCHQDGLDQATFTAVRHANALPSTHVALLTPCPPCQLIEGGMTQPTVDPDDLVTDISHGE